MFSSRFFPSFPQKTSEKPTRRVAFSSAFVYNKGNSNRTGGDAALTALVQRTCAELAGSARRKKK